MYFEYFVDSILFLLLCQAGPGTLCPAEACTPPTFAGAPGIKTLPLYYYLRPTLHQHADFNLSEGCFYHRYAVLYGCQAMLYYCQLIVQQI